MFSRKRKRTTDSLTEQSEKIAEFFAQVKDACGYACVPCIEMDVRNEVSTTLNSTFLAN